MPTATDDGIVWRVYDPANGGFYTNWRSRSHWTLKHHAVAAANDLNQRRIERGLPLAVVKEFKLVEVTE